MNVPGTNTGHGHVWERPDGFKARCGGPGLCKECSSDRHRVKYSTAHVKVEGWKPIASAPRDGTPILVLISKEDAAKGDAQHGRARVATHRGMGWIVIPGMWSIRPTHWQPIDRAPEETA